MNESLFPGSMVASSGAPITSASNGNSYSKATFTERRPWLSTNIVTEAMPASETMNGLLSSSFGYSIPSSQFPRDGSG